ncbi:replicative DNA helicase [bacterium]|nr:replicative DNA helicase [bacterium]
MASPEREVPASLTNYEPPKNLEAERCVLGCMLIDEVARAKAFGFVTRDSFTEPAHREIFSVIRSKFDGKEAVDVVTVNDALQGNEAYLNAGGPAYLAALVECVPTTENIEYYADIVQDKALLRELVVTCRKAISECNTSGRNAKEIISEAEQNMVGLLKDRNKGFLSVGELMLPNIEMLEKLTKARQKGATVTGLDTGFRDINTMTAGFHPGELIILAARPSMGKTALALNLAEHVAEKNKAAVAFFSLEMGPDELVRRLLSSRAGVRGQNLRRGDMTAADYSKIVRAAGNIKELDLFIDSSPSLTPIDIKSRCQLLRAKCPNFAAIFVDYIQLLSAGSDKQFKDNRVQEISYISRSLKSLAVELKVPVIALSQLNRQAEQGSEKGNRPQLSHLRESGSIEQDADMVMMLYRPNYYNKEASVDDAEVIIAKQRNGPTGTIKMIFNPEYARFTDGVAEK